MDNSTGDGFVEYLKTDLINTILEAIHNNSNDTVDSIAKVTGNVITFGAPLFLMDIAHSLSAFLWLILFTGSIVTMGRMEQDEKEKKKKEEADLLSLNEPEEKAEVEEADPLSDEDEKLVEEEFEDRTNHTTDDSISSDLVEETAFQESIAEVDITEEPK